MTSPEEKYGGSFAEISAQGGWKNFSVLKRYTHLAPEYLAKKLM